MCALYIPGVAFADVDKLGPVTLFEMPYAKWGARVSKFIIHASNLCNLCLLSGLYCLEMLAAC